jgi:hypothetical protein
MAAAAVAGLMLIAGCAGEDAPADNPNAGSGATQANSAPPSPTGPTPEETVRTYLDAGGKKDCETVMEVSTERYWSQGGKQTREEALANCTSGQVPNASLSEVNTTGGDDAATVTAKLTINGQTGNAEFKLLKEDGVWKVDDLQVSEA